MSRKSLMTLGEFRAELARLCKDAGGQEKYAKKLGISQPYLSQLLTGRQIPGPTMCKKLGIEKEVMIRWPKK